MTNEQISLMIVESQPMMRNALRSILSAEGMTVLALVADDRDAIHIASTLDPDLILFSVNHPGLTELDRISVLRQEVPESSIIVLVTGEYRGQAQAALERGAHLVLTRSRTRSELLKAIQWVVQRKNYPATAQVN